MKRYWFRVILEDGSTVKVLIQASSEARANELLELLIEEQYEMSIVDIKCKDILDDELGEFAIHGPGSKMHYTSM